MSRFEQTWSGQCPYDCLGKVVAGRAIQVCRPNARGENVMSFGIYIIGFLILIGGLIYGAVLIHMPSHWIVVGAIVLVGLGILTGVKNTRQKDSSS
jgi:uncharacterized membrane protein